MGDVDQDAMIDRLTAELPSAVDVLDGLQMPSLGTSVSMHGVACFTFEEFTDSRLLLALGIGQEGSKGVAWCLWGAKGNRAASSGAATVGVPDDFSEGARRALHLLAVDQHESEEAAAAELADIEVAIEVAGLALFVHQRKPHSGSAAADFGATIHAVIPGSGDIDVVCLGTPIWIRAQ